ncbi:MAG: hypothetical protein LC720_09515, partial [Actinobacteria bacterium]|nr:hypothetical protein [Actinomycetota bacterium]
MERGGCMRTFLPRSVFGALLISLTAGAVAQAAPTPGAVTVRVEGANATLIPPTLVGTQPGTVTPINDPSHSCPGTSAMRALDLATLVHGTSWSGT